MKIKFLLLIAFISSTVAVPMVAQVKIGVEAGVNYSHYLGAGEYQNYIAKEIGGMKPGFQMGVTVDYEMKNNWILLSGLSFLQNRSTMAVASNMVFYFPETDVKINNLVLPVRIGYNIPVNDNLSFTPSIGTYASYAFSAGSCDMVAIYPTDSELNPKAVKWKPMSGYSYEPAGGWVASIPQHSRLDIGGIVGIKATVYKNYTISFNYSVGIKQVFVNKLRNSNFQFSIGYQF